jgi:hypothetical protein
VADVAGLVSFSLCLYPESYTVDNRQDFQPIVEYSDKGINWSDYQRLKVPGFDSVQTVCLTDFWNSILSEQIEEITVPVVGVETIIKWSNTRQIKQQFKLHARLIFSQN